MKTKLGGSNLKCCLFCGRDTRTRSGICWRCLGYKEPPKNWTFDYGLKVNGEIHEKTPPLDKGLFELIYGKNKK